MGSQPALGVRDGDIEVEKGAKRTKREEPSSERKCGKREDSESAVPRGHRPCRLRGLLYRRILQLPSL
ncbi:hypothetical protein NDU88_001640 [Pleurodeles waltl]|uniref:Uncharacterized protein n=1 Tax=Pleurodeles waltl TaxID=8319 RepID=A0AAV7M8R5_PLEWA|nr:hypothetical protein NDU88_001640 [Pleurodeles waltl]